MQQLCGTYGSYQHVLSLLRAAQLPSCCRCRSTSTKSTSKAEERRSGTLVSRHGMATSRQLRDRFNGHNLDLDLELDGSVGLARGPGEAIIAPR